MLEIHPNTLRRWEKIGKIKAVRTKGGARRFPESEVRRLLQERTSLPPRPPPLPPGPPLQAPEPPALELGITSPFPGGLILLGAALLLTCRLIWSSFEVQTFLFDYAVFVALTGSSVHMMKRGIVKNNKVARGGGRALTLLLLVLSAFCGGTGVLLCLNFGLLSPFRFALLISWLLLLGILVEWKYRY
jgi:hypothetical protein